jgi:hypothetical protein
MAVCTVVFTSNVDGTITVTSTSAPVTPKTSKSITELCNWAQGIVFQTLGIGLN